MRGFANSDLDRRLLKARKIEHLVGGVGQLAALDLGAGSGYLSDYFASRGADMISADRDGGAFAGSCPFVEIEQTLPFEADRFDLVIFNHVIEHVGQIEAQKSMLNEIVRVLRQGGRLYLAAPTKWALIEPHFRIPLLGAMPRAMADATVRVLGKGECYDCFPLRAAQMRKLLEERFRNVDDVSKEAFRWMALNEMHALKYVPAIPCLFPTRMFVATL